MEHLSESRIIEALYDGLSLTNVEEQHLSLCNECKKHYDLLNLLQQEFEIARKSELNPEAEGRLNEILEQSILSSSQETPFHNLLGIIAGWTNALPMWDSRRSQSTLGIRSLNTTTYRMIFGAEETEVELMVEPHNGLLRVVGEISTQAAQQNGLALIEMSASADAKTALEAESDMNGRFTLEHVPPGTYFMTITPRYSQTVIIEALELT